MGGLPLSSAALWARCTRRRSLVDTCFAVRGCRAQGSLPQEVGCLGKCIFNIFSQCPLAKEKPLSFSRSPAAPPRRGFLLGFAKVSSTGRRWVQGECQRVLHSEWAVPVPRKGWETWEWCPVLPGPWRRQATTSTCPPWGPRPPLSQRHPATAREMWPTITTNRTCDWGVCLELLVSGAWKPV